MSDKANKDSSLKPKLHKLDSGFQAEMAYVLEMGDLKYGELDWQRGMNWSELIDSAERHIAAMKGGIFIDGGDGGSKRRHTAHVGTCMMMLDHYMQHSADYGDYNNLGMTAHTDGLGRYYGWGDVDAVHAMTAKRYLAEYASTFKPDKVVDPLKQLQERIFTWADSVMPQRTAEDALKKLIMEEIPELLTSAGDDPLEWADIFILVLDCMKLKNIDPIAVSHRKMNINEARKWAISERTGLLNHVEKTE